jgi:hypothetical protein
VAQCSRRCGSRTVHWCYLMRDALIGNQMQSDAIRCNQVQSGAISTVSPRAVDVALRPKALDERRNHRGDGEIAPS